MAARDKPLVWLRGEIKTPPMSAEARIEAGFLLRQLQSGVLLGLPHLRPMRSIGARCYELRVVDERASWRIVLRIDGDAIVIVDIFRKTTVQTPEHILEMCRLRLKQYDGVVRGDAK
jgi:phage-related protein